LEASLLIEISQVSRQKPSRDTSSYLQWCWQHRGCAKAQPQMVEGHAIEDDGKTWERWKGSGASSFGRS
jgi:hypothetical protein